MTPTLPEVHRSMHVPSQKGFWRKLLAFAGPGYLVAVGYMDPGNWATDLAAGSKYNYSLLSVILVPVGKATLLALVLCRLVLPFESHALPLLWLLGVELDKVTDEHPVLLFAST